MRPSPATQDSAAAVPDAVSVILRIGVVGCFVGHGAFGIITKAAWVPYFAVGGVSEPLAWQLMPWVGAMDILVAALVLAWPCRGVFLWAVLWATWTALLRPLSGEPVWEFFERAGNYGVPFALLALAGIGRPLFTRLGVRVGEAPGVSARTFAWILRITTATLLAGHAGLGLIAHKAGLARHYAAIGFEQPAALVPAVGAAEFFLAALVLLRPKPGLLVGICLWKLFSESLFLVAGAPFSVFELVERCGSYTAPLALAVLLAPRLTPPPLASLPSPPHARLS